MILKNRVLYQILFFILLFNQPVFSSDKPDLRNLDELLNYYDSAVTQYIEESEAPGAAIAIVEGGEIVFIKGYGKKKADGKELINEQTVFRLASVSKGFASVLTGLLVKDGFLKWDDKVTKYLPEFSLEDKANTDNLTIRHILSHTSGLVPHAYDNLVEAKVPYEKIVKKLSDLPAYCPPGDCYGYQNVVYSLIADIIKAATGKEYTELLTERILKPLGMDRTTFSKKQFIDSKNYASPHVRIKSGWKSVSIRETYYNTAPAAGINSSIHDMAQWLLAMLGNKRDVIPPSVINDVSTPLIKTPQELRRYTWGKRVKSIHYGLGWRIFDYSGYNLIYHSGNLHGYFAAIAFLPEYNTGIVILQNSSHYNFYVSTFFDLYLKMVKDMEKKSDLSNMTMNR